MSAFDLAKKYLDPEGRKQPTAIVDPERSEVDPSVGRIIACLIASEVLGCDIWVALDDDFDPGDGLAVFYADELEFLKNKDADTLREIHRVKLAFPGSRVGQ